jgi:hypothetical protein
MAESMGFHLTDSVTMLGMTGRLSGLSPSAIGCLFVMGHVARDKPSKREQARVYFGGWEYLGRTALGRIEYDDAAHRAVGRAMRELVDAGLVKDVGRRNGMRHGAVMYELMIGEL